MKSTGRNSGSPEYAIYDSNTIVHRDTFYERSDYDGRCYRYEEPSGIHSRIGREGGMARRRIPAALFARLLGECETQIAEVAKREAAS